MRLFFAVELPDSLKALLAGEQQRLTPLLPGLRWVRPEGIHITLAFIGEVAEQQLSELCAAGKSACEAFATQAKFGGPGAGLTLHAVGGGVFGRPERARVVWVGLRQDAGLAGLRLLADKLRNRLAEKNLPFDPAPFAPHITLGRASKTADCRGRLPALAETAFRADCLVLFQSRLGDGPARYEALHWWRIGGNTIP